MNGGSVGESVMAWLEKRDGDDLVNETPIELADPGLHEAMGLGAKTTDDDVLNGLLDLLRDDLDSGEGGSAAINVLNRARKAGGSKLLEVFEDPDEADEVRCAVGQLLSDHPPALTALSDALLDPSPDRVRAALWALCYASFEIDAAMPRIVDLVQHQDPGVRNHAIHALGSLGAQAEPALPVLIEAKKGCDDELQRDDIEEAIRDIREALEETGT